MKMITKIKNYLIDIGIERWIPDEKYLKRLYKKKMHKELNLDNPKTYNEKLQWLKLYDRNPLYSNLVDKFEVKKYVASIIGEKYIIPTLGIWNKYSEIDFDKLPDQFVLKCTNDSGGIAICHKKSDFNKKKQKLRLTLYGKRNFYYRSREWPYKNVKQRIIAEEYMEDNKYHELRDYKFFCFNGIPKIMFVATNRQGEGETYFDFFDMHYNHLNIINGHPNAPKTPEKPINFDKMIELSQKLSKDIPHVRVDFYEVNGKVYFGEMTFYHWSGLVPFEPEKWDKVLGDYISIKNNELLKGGKE